MKKLLHRLAKQATESKKIGCVDSEISFHSLDRFLIELFTGPLEYFLPPVKEDLTHSVSCIIGSTTMIDDWPRILEQDALRITRAPIDNLEADKSILIETECGVTLVVEGIGSIYHSGDGQFLCLVEPPGKDLQSGEILNVQTLAMVLISETLLLKDKLLVHAGCVGKDGACQIWTGDSGVGKTTRVLSLLRKGYQYYGEDQLIVGRDAAGERRVWPFWRHIKVTAETSKLLPTPQDISKITPDDRKKYTFENIEEVLKTSKPDSGRLDSIVKIIPGNQKINRKLDFVEAFQQISPGFMHSLLPSSNAKVMDIALDIISDTPSYLVSWDMLDQFELF